MAQAVAGITRAAHRALLAAVAVRVRCTFCLVVHATVAYALTGASVWTFDHLDVANSSINRRRINGYMTSISRGWGGGAAADPKTAPDDGLNATQQSESPWLGKPSPIVHPFLETHVSERAPACARGSKSSLWVPSGWSLGTATERGFDAATRRPRRG